MLHGKTVVIGVSGGIAAYKSVEIVSRLKKLGASVFVVMTEHAANFVNPLTFREISGNPAVVDMWEEPKNWNVQHISLARAADIMVIAPATANVIGKISNGLADDLLSTTVMATTAPVLLAPAMNSAMYENPIVQQNIEKLTNLGYHFIEPEAGHLACGESGPGRLPEPAYIVAQIMDMLVAKRDFAGKTILVTAGGTREPIDPVRYIGNRSSGKMGFALATAAKNRGANVILVTGPSSLPDVPGVVMDRVETAAEMFEAVLRHFNKVDIVIKAAAVADYRPTHISTQKIKKQDGNLVITLERNPDILQELGQRKTKQILVGFAAETQDVIQYARDKMTRKHLDMIIANDVTQNGAGFNSDTNIVKVLNKDGAVETLDQMPKKQLANILLDRIKTLLPNT